MNNKAILLFLFLMSPGFFAQKINILYPNGGEILFTTNYDRIIFSEKQRSVTIYFSSDNGKTWNELNDARWQPQEKPKINSDSCLIKVMDRYNSSNFDISDSVFSLSDYRPDYSSISSDNLTANSLNLNVNNNSFSFIVQGNVLQWKDSNSEMWQLIWTYGFAVSSIQNGDTLVSGGYFGGSNHLPGAILPNGRPDDPSKEIYKIWHLNKKWASPFIPEIDSFKRLFKYNYDHWPVEIGAPWEDLDNDGNYMPSIDRPYLYPDEILYFVTNGLDTNYSYYTRKCRPSGLEFRTTVYDFERSNFLRDVVFYEVTVINKSGKRLNKAEFSFYADISISNHLANYAGCDTTLSLGFGYNKIESSPFNRGVIPAVGVVVLKGALPGEKNMNSYSVWEEDSYLIPPPDPNSSLFSFNSYNLQSGKYANGNPYIDPLTGKVTKYMNYGDPESGTGWLDGKYDSGERSISLNSGPVDLFPGDTAKVVYAIVAAQGSDHLNSVTKLKEKVKLVSKFYKDSLASKTNVHSGYIFPKEYRLKQNYPNPFNSSTTIEFILPAQNANNDSDFYIINLEIYDILGRRVAKLFDGIESAGRYKIQFNAENLSSGVYIYRLKTQNFRIKSQTFEETKKMILLK